jgi:hypothetical protein
MEERAKEIADNINSRDLQEALELLDEFLVDYRDLLDEKVTTDTNISDIYDVVEIIDAALQRYIQAEHPDAPEFKAPLRSNNDYQDDEDYEEHYEDVNWNDHGSAERKKYEKAWEYLYELRELMVRNFQLPGVPNVGGRRKRRKAKTVRRRRSTRRRLRRRPTRRRRPF